MPLETVLAYALTSIGVLLSMLIALVVYVFFNLKSDVKSVATEVADLNKSRVKLVHKDECRSTIDRMHNRLDEVLICQKSLGDRITRVEASLDKVVEIK